MADVRIGETGAAKQAPPKSQSVAPGKSKSAGGDDAKATSIGELIKQKLGAVAVKGKDAKKDEEEDDE